MAGHDKIEKQVMLRAPQSRVWRALTNTEEFGRWFGVQLDGAFTPGKPIRGIFDESKLDEARIMEAQRRAGVTPSRVKFPGANATFCTVETLQPESYFSFRWIPYGIDAEADLANEPTTLVEFRLEPVPDGTRLSITESGFENVPQHRRERAFRMNEGGWTGQSENLRKYVES